jgi:hypothetical protein
MNINTKDGKVFRGDQQLQDSVGLYLDLGYRWWVNDSYWVFMPYKLKDSGVTLNYLREDTAYDGSASDVLRLSFENVGVTPDNIYEIWVNTDTKLVTQWAYYQDSEQEQPGFITPWADYRQYGDIMLSGNRGQRSITDIDVLDSVPEGIFSNLETNAI